MGGGRVTAGGPTIESSGDMTREQVRLLLQRHQEALNRHDVSGLAGLYAEEAVLVSPMFETVRGRQAIRRSFERLFEVFPDYAITMRDALFLCEGDRAAEFSTVTGTHQEALYGLPPTGQQIEYHAARLFTLRHGLIVYEQRVYDFGGVLDRLEKTRLDRELTNASEVQQTLMARTNSRGDFFEVVGSSLPCRAIGGDFLEYLDLPSGQFGLAVGDVSGKGPAAALVAAMLQGMFSMVAAHHAGPEDTLVRLNRALCQRGMAPRYATLFYGVLSPDGRLTYSNAGHTPPMLLSAAGIRLLTAGGPILGVFDEATFPEETVVLAPGDTLVAYSDGVTDAAAPGGDDFGMDRLISTTRAHGSARPHELVEGLLATLRHFCHTAPPTDDATIAVLRFR